MVFLLTVGRPNMPGAMVDAEQESTFVGNETLIKSGDLKKKHHIKADFDNRENLTQIFFETFFVTSLYVTVRRKMNIMMDSGDNVLQIAPICESHTLPLNYLHLKVIPQSA